MTRDDEVGPPTDNCPFFDDLRQEVRLPLLESRNELVSVEGNKVAARLGIEQNPNRRETAGADDGRGSDQASKSAKDTASGWGSEHVGSLA